MGGILWQVTSLQGAMLVKMGQATADNIIVINDKIDSFKKEMREQFSNGDCQSINNKVKAIDEEYRRLSVKTEKTKSKLETMEEKYKFFERQLTKLTKSDQDQSEVSMGYDILEKADNHNFDLKKKY